MARQFTVHAAEARLSKLIKAATGRDDVVIDRGGKPVVRQVAIPSAKFKIGLLKGKLGPGPDFFEPLGDAGLDGWEGSA